MDTLVRVRVGGGDGGPMVFGRHCVRSVPKNDNSDDDDDDGSSSGNNQSRRKPRQCTGMRVEPHAARIQGNPI